MSTSEKSTQEPEMSLATTIVDSTNAEKCSQSTEPAQDPPNGGLRAWLQVLGAFFLFLNSWGIVNTFGVYQTFYETDMMKDQSSSNISWIGAIQAFLLLIVGVVTGPVFDAGGFYILIALGSFLVVFGLFMTSLCTQYWQVMLAQAICIGLGSGCLFIPSVAIVSTYFTTKKSFATGIVASGSSLGGVIYPIIFAQLQPKIGFGWATRVIAFIALAGLLLSCLVMRVRITPTQKRRLLDLSAFKEVPYTMFSFGEFFGFMGLYIPFFYVQLYAQEQGTMTDHLAFYLLAILNAASAFGRIMPNFLADKTGPLNILIPCSLASTILAFGWIGIQSNAAIIIFCVLYGFFSGTFVSLPPTTVVSLSPSLSTVGTRMGMSFSFAGFGLLIGTPIAGAILKNGSWIGAQLFCALTVTIATLCMTVARLSKNGEICAKA